MVLLVLLCVRLDAAVLVCRTKGESISMDLRVETDDLKNGKAVSLSGLLHFSDKLKDQFKGEFSDARLTLEHLSQLGVGTQALVIKLHWESAVSAELPEKLIYHLQLSAPVVENPNPEDTSFPTEYKERFYLYKFKGQVKEVADGRFFGFTVCKIQ